MKKIILLILAVSVVGTASAQKSESRRTICFDSGWKFFLGDQKNAYKPGFNDKSWRSLSVPHDWSIEGQNDQDAPGGGNVGYFPGGIGWYRKTFDLPDYTPGNKLSVEFDGVYMDSEVWINGHYLGKWPYGYTTFSYDLTPYVKAAGNVIAVRVDNSAQPNSRWYTGSGIYRHVRLVETSALRFDNWSVFVYTESLGEEMAELKISASVVDQSTANHSSLKWVNTLYTHDGRIAAQKETLVSAPGMDLSQTLQVGNPVAWSIENPYMYTLETRLIADGTEVDCVLTPTGIRTIYYDVDLGFFLNGQRVKMKGVNLHHDAGGLGAAVPERVWERRLEILKAGGCNAIRTAHNPPAPELLDLCDRMGFLVMDEVFDEWQDGKRDYSYHIYFDQWFERDLRAMLRRDRNHPSIVMWSIGNEVPDQSSENGPQLAKTMIDICHQEDPTRLVTSGNDRIVADDTPASEEFLAAFENDIVGYNYPDRWHKRRELVYSLDRHAHPNWRMVGSETSGMGGRRGEYSLGNNPDKVVANYTGGRRIDVEQRWKFTLIYDYVIGDFMWTGIDYYGESRWPARGSSSGYLDNAGFPKDGYWFFKSIWTDEPTLYLYPHWNWPGREGQVIPVVCYTNCDSVELLVNGKSYGEKLFEFPRKGNDQLWNQHEPGKVFTSTANLHLAWDVVYEPGELTVIGKKNGKEYRYSVVTTGQPHSVRLTVDRDVIRTGNRDVAHIVAEVVDEQGRVVPTAGNMIEFEIEGASIIGVESGDMTNLESVKIPRRNAFSGKCLAIVQAPVAGEITVRATSDSLIGDSVIFRAID